MNGKDAKEIIDLGKGWILINEQNNIKIETGIPSTVFESLINHNIVNDPFYGLNEHKVKWVYESDWQYINVFTLDGEFLKNPTIKLRFYGLDTIAEIYLNGELLDKTNNMFRIYEYEVKSKLRNKRNYLRILFKSPIKYANEEISKYGVRLTTGDPNVAIAGIPYLRKAQYSFGWDWGPKLPDIGIWKPIELIGFSDISFRSFYVDYNFDYDETQLQKKSSLGSNTNIPAKVKVLIKIKLDLIKHTLNYSEYQLETHLIDPSGIKFIKSTDINSNIIKATINIENPKLWWTHDLGVPNLYTLKIKLIKNDETIDTVVKKIGIRDIKLIRREDTWGETFYIQLNGIPIFAKGANWIPIDSFIARGKKQGLYLRNLRDAKKANMNMMRVWGGGIYEDNKFYDLCDRMGMLVWQDFPFACAIYPYQKDFIENVRKEVIQNVKQLRNHPSLALWCGNNEVEYLWRFLVINSEIKDENVELKYKKAYREIFERLIPKLVNQYDSNRPYWASSPSNGYVHENLGKVNSNSPDRGDSHFWGVWHGGKSFKAYLRFNSRFMSEFGFESFPSLKTVESFCPENQFNMFSEIMENHQKNSEGNDKILKYMKRRYTIPENFKKQIILSQISQAEAIDYGVRYWRANRNNFHCMGTLYWQLNDCWPVVSWSSVDYFGRWKALHYLAKRFYRTIIGSFFEKRGKFKFYVINDSRKDIDIHFEFEIVNSKSKSLYKQNGEATILSLSSHLVDEGTFKELNITPKTKIITYKIIKDNNGGLIDHGFYFLDDPKDYDIPNPGLDYEIKVKNVDNNKVQLKLFLKSKLLSFFTYIESSLIDFIASDNYFHMNPDESREIILSINNSQNLLKIHSIEEIENSIQVKSLYDLIS